MKHNFLLLLLSLFMFEEAFGQTFSFTQDIQVVFVDTAVGNCTVSYNALNNLALVIGAGGAGLPAGYALPASPFNIVANSSAGSFQLSYPASIAGLTLIRINATSGTNVVDSTDIYFIPKSQMKTFVSIAFGSGSEIEEPKNDITKQVYVIGDVQPIFPYTANLTLEIDYAKSDFPNVTSGVRKTVAHSVGNSSNVVLQPNLRGSAAVKDDRILVFRVVDQYGNEWAVDTLKVKSHEGSTKLRSLQNYISIGGSVDFLKDVDKPVSTFSEIYVRSNPFGLLTPANALARTARGEGINHWSVSGHYYAATVVSTRDTLERFSEHVPFETREQDSVTLVKGFGRQVRINASNFYTLAGRINYNVMPKLGDEHQIFAYMNFEGLIRKSQQRYENIGSPTYDSTRYAVADLEDQLTRYAYSDPIFRSSQYERTRFEGYGGFGLRYEWQTDEIQFMVDAGIGFAFYDLHYFSPAGFPNMSSLYYNNEFSLIVKDFGVKFGGEIRSKFKPTGAVSIDRWRPLGMLYLSKTFSVQKLAEFLRGV